MLTLDQVLNIPPSEKNHNIYTTLNTGNGEEKVLHQIKGYTSSSASSSDLVKANIHFDSNVIVPIFIKIFAHSERGEGLLYEARVYSYLLKNVYLNLVSRNIPIVIASNSQCSLSNLFSLLGKKHRKAILRNIPFLHCKIKNRPSVTDMHTSLESLNEKHVYDDCEFVDKPETLNYNSLERKAQRYDYGYVMTREMDDVTINEFLYKHPDMFDSILFQVLYTVVCMNLMGVYHRDLHCGNIFIDRPTNFEGTTCLYAIDSNHFYMIKNENVLPRIYDFDRSHVQDLGTNIFMTDKTRMKNYGKDPVHDYRDIIMITCDLRRLLSKRLFDFSFLFKNRIETFPSSVSKCLKNVDDIAASMYTPIDIIRKLGTPFRISLKDNRTKMTLRSTFKTFDNVIKHTYVCPKAERSKIEQLLQQCWG